MPSYSLKPSKPARRLALRCLLCLLANLTLHLPGVELPFNDHWQFFLGDTPSAQAPDFADQAWAGVTLPHTAHLEPLPDGHQPRQWQGLCWYRQTFALPATAAGKVVSLRFDGAMNAAEIWVNGQSAGKFQGGYLPYVLDISVLVHPGASNCVAVRLDNRDNPITGPKPLADLDFNLYSGLYRSAHLIIQDQLHITDPILADKVAGGGVFVTFPAVSASAAVVRIQTHVRNESPAPRTFALKSTLLDPRGKSVAIAESPVTLAAGADQQVTQEVSVAQPKLWSPRSPSLYQVRSELVASGQVVDATVTRVGIRRIQITADGFVINGEKMFLRGCNRHQEYPFIGNAIPDAAQYRDALNIKAAGFDYIRLSHYPQSPAFLDACDELGLVVMDGILGWQYFNPNPAFAAQKYQESRQLIRRDRNHPCVILWELSLNESDMPAAFIRRCHALAHEEYPGDQCYTAGWEKGYDVFLQARQHGGCRGLTNQPCLVSEYGDWEYYAQNAGFDQAKWKDLQPAARNSRQLRGDGDTRLLQQALNFQEAHNDNLHTPAFGDGIWAMFDYSRGYAPDLESSGVMDVFRLPKFGYWFFRSQRDATEPVAGSQIGPVLFIANDWTATSPLEVRVYANADEVALCLNGQMMERRRPDATRSTTALKHPPFTFKLPQFQPGTLRAVAYVANRQVAEAERRTPGELHHLTLALDQAGLEFAAPGSDVVFCRASLADADHTLVPGTSALISFGCTGPAQLIGNNPARNEAGIATVLLKSDVPKPRSVVYALSLIAETNQTRILAAAIATSGVPVPSYTIHYTTDGSEPSAASPVYAKPISGAAKVRAAVIVSGQVVVQAGQ